jgi:hypothetical protein
MRAGEILALAVEARGRRRWPADGAARTGTPAAAWPPTAAHRGSAPASGAHSVTSQTAGQFDVHFAGNGEATSRSNLVGSQRSTQVDSARVTRLNCSGGLCVYIAEGLGLHRATR